MGGERTTDIEFECPECGERGEVRIAEGQTEATLACRCGWSELFTYDGEPAVAWQRLRETIENAKRKLRPE